MSPRIFLTLAICFCLAPGAAALDGHLEYRNDRNEGNSGPNDYSLQIIRQEGLVSQRVPLLSWLSLQGDGSAWDEDTESRVDTTKTERRRTAQRVGASLQVGMPGLRFMLDGSGDRRKTTGGTAAERLDRLVWGAWSSLRYGSLLRARASWLDSDSRRYADDVEQSERRETIGSFHSESQIPHFGRLMYRFTRIETDYSAVKAIDLDTTHGIQYSGSRRFLADRASVSLDLRSNFFEQSSSTRDGSVDSLLQLPLGAYTVIDTSPEAHDPLEADLIPVPELFDRDRATATIIDLGDEAPIGWQYGGDYRNIQYDFGEAVEITGAVLYVDQVLPAPDLFQWRIFYSNDPTGLTWEELGAAVATYWEWSSDLQGWDISVKPHVHARYFKLVNKKIGPTTLSQLFVTELEVFTREVDEGADRAQRTQNHKLSSQLGYEISRDLHFRYELSLRRRLFDTDRPDLEESNHGLGLTWNPSVWRVAGRYEIHKVGTEERRGTDVKTYSAAIHRELAERHDVSLSWSRVDDESESLRKSTNNLTLGARWQVAPDLRLTQRVGYGWLNDWELNRSSSSVTLYTTLIGQPVPSFLFDLTRSDRWVEREAGVGFTQFNDSALNMTWNPLPLVGVSSAVRYEERDQGYWQIRNSVSWTPLPGGDVEIRLFASHYRDTHLDSEQAGGGANLSWRPRRQLHFEAGVEALGASREAEQSSPLSTFFRGNLTF